MLPISPKPGIMKEILWWMGVRAILVFLVIPLVLFGFLFRTMWDMLVIAWLGYKEVHKRFGNDEERTKGRK